VKFEKDAGLFLKASKDEWRGKKQFGASKKKGQNEPKV
jgi:hypothetical protein